jgi:predicted ArsR family transcriptional regulator
MQNATGYGPAPVRTDRPREAALRVLRWLSAADGPVTISALNQALGGHPNSVRAQLQHLVATGFASEVALPAAGRGRPALAYRPTLAGTQVALEEPGRDDNRALVEAVAEQLAASPEPVVAAHALGRAWGSRIEPSGEDTLVDLLGAQGFTPQQTPEGIALRTCPLLQSALRNPEVVCGIHQGLIDAVSPTRRELVPFAAPGICLVRTPDAEPPEPPDRPQGLPRALA